jgi:phenylacetic acid degradation operon negative regulatory protein
MSLSLIQQHIKNDSVSCTSMVITVFGDTISQHGDWIWLSSLIKVLEPFGFNARQVRTSVYRLVQSNWLQVKKNGRCSYYSFTEFAKKHYEKAARRIYASNQPAWDQNWILVLPVSVPEEKKEDLRKSLLWMGFNTLSTSLYAHPSSERTSLDELIQELGICSDVIVLSAKTQDLNSQGVMKSLTKSRWQLSELEILYQNFLAFYQPLYQKIMVKLPEPSECFLLRTTIVHDFRRILLRDPDFPDEMLPNEWVGKEVHELVKKIYNLLSKVSIEYCQQHMENVDGKIPLARVSYFSRFGGVS